MKKLILFVPILTTTVHIVDSELFIGKILLTQGNFTINGFHLKVEYKHGKNFFEPGLPLLIFIQTVNHEYMTEKVPRVQPDNNTNIG